MKIIITGNSGSGKTWLSNKIASLEAQVIHLDTIYWQPGGFDKKREQPEIENLISQSMIHQQWIAEGVFGQLLVPFLNEASMFILLDLPWELCRKRLEERGSESKKHMNRTQSAKGLLALIEWAQNYYTRKSLTSKFGHQKLFESFEGHKIRLQSEEEVNDFISKMHNHPFEQNR